MWTFWKCGFIIYWKTLPLINKQTRFIASVMHRLCTFLSQNISREQGRCSFCHELLIQEHTVVALCKTYTRLEKNPTKTQTKKGIKEEESLLSYMKQIVFHIEKRWTWEHDVHPMAEATCLEWRAVYLLWAVYLPCHYPSSILTNTKFFTSVCFWTNQKTLKLGIPHLMRRKQCLLLFRFPLAKENEHFVLGLMQRWEFLNHSHQRELVCSQMLSCWIKNIHLMG